MATAKYKNFIPQNTAPKGALHIGVYNSKGEEIITIPLGNLSSAEVGEKLYSFGAISDPHLQKNTGKDDFARALTYFSTEERVDFVCVNGDLSQNGTDADLAEYKDYVNIYSNGMPVYAITGNHDTWGGLNVETVISSYTGNPLYYSFTQGNDVFIMLGIRGEVTPFANDELQWLYDTLEANRSRRCFVFMHLFPSSGKQETCGNAYAIYNNYCWTHATQTVLFVELMKHYKNVLFFHGHSHLKFELQSADCKYANYTESDGYRSIHISSLVAPREKWQDGVKELYAESEGYVVDVYENHIVLQGRDFVKGEFLPIATYKIDTTLQTVEANTFTDNTGTITTK